MKTYKNLIEFEKGTFPLILSISHGGTLECETIPKRENGILGTDTNTIELTQDLISNIKEISKNSIFNERKPSYIISKVRRSKIDLNRLEGEAYNPNSLLGKEIYRCYHGKIKELILENIKSHDYSMLLDIHGFERNKRPSGYRDVELILGTNNLESFFSKSIPKKDWANNIRGKIIRRFLDLNIPIAPGHPRRKEYVLTGGFITQEYGASTITNSQAIQIEFSDRIRKFDKNLRRIVLRTLAEVFVKEITCRINKSN